MGTVDSRTRRTAAAAVAVGAAGGHKLAVLAPVVAHVRARGRVGVKPVLAAVLAAAKAAAPAKAPAALALPLACAACSTRSAKVSCETRFSARSTDHHCRPGCYLRCRACRGARRPHARPAGRLARRASARTLLSWPAAGAPGRCDTCCSRRCRVSCPACLTLKLHFPGAAHSFWRAFRVPAAPACMKGTGW